MEQIDVNEFSEAVNNIVSKVIEEIKDMNWFVRKSDGLLYYYKYKPATINYGNYLFPQLKIIPVAGDKAILFKEANDAFGYIPKNVLMHRDEIIKHKRSE